MKKNAQDTNLDGNIEHLSRWAYYKLNL